LLLLGTSGSVMESTISKGTRTPLLSISTGPASVRLTARTMPVTRSLVSLMPEMLAPMSVPAVES